MRCWWVALFVFIGSCHLQCFLKGAMRCCYNFISRQRMPRAFNSVTVHSSRMGDVEDFPDFREASSPGPRVTFNIQDTVNKINWHPLHADQTETKVLLPRTPPSCFLPIRSNFNVLRAGGFCFCAIFHKQKIIISSSILLHYPDCPPVFK